MKLTKEQTELWKRWIAELKSGRHVQTTNVLHKLDGSKCCLGVACDLVGVDPVMGTGKYLYEGFSENVPPKIQQLFGFVHVYGFNCPKYINLAALNDVTFNPNKPDYSNVLPVIEEYFEANKYVEVAAD